MPEKETKISGSGSSESLPTVLRPKTERGTTEIHLENVGPDTSLPAAVVQEVSEDLGLVTINSKCLKRLAEIGAGIDSMGSVQVANGSVLIPLKVALMVAQKIGEGVTDPKAARESAKPIADVLNAINKAAASLKYRVPTSAKAAPGPNRTQCFEADVPIHIDQAVVNVQK